FSNDFAMAMNDRPGVAKTPASLDGGRCPDFSKDLACPTERESRSSYATTGDSRLGSLAGRSDVVRQISGPPLSWPPSAHALRGELLDLPGLGDDLLHAVFLSRHQRSPSVLAKPLGTTYEMDRFRGAAHFPGARLGEQGV